MALEIDKLYKVNCEYILNQHILDQEKIPQHLQDKLTADTWEGLPTLLKAAIVKPVFHIEEGISCRIVGINEDYFTKTKASGITRAVLTDAIDDRKTLTMFFSEAPFFIEHKDITILYPDE